MQKKRKFKYLKGEYIPTTKNNIVKNIYKDMGSHPKIIIGYYVWITMKRKKVL